MKGLYPALVICNKSKKHETKCALQYDVRKSPKHMFVRNPTNSMYNYKTTIICIIKVFN